ncbi:NEDD8-activating enzyme E1 regulatory subunit-like isoform X1 [Mytilus trossulus]|uniref:NEDD8-activating enzyme E1 regulatory subunit-like isoform X1 n=1 Tax=Mytilus trossulus TaxID=6551 RepID=UPI003005DC32
MADTKKVVIDKKNKYDRQLRLWGDHGQSALESACVCLVNVSAVGTEILKNMILPGVGSFTIVDGNKVSGEDVGNNFFLTKDNIGESRAKAATELLSELNDDVSGDFVEESAEKLIRANPDFFSRFTLVIATNLCERELLELDSLLSKRNIPLLVCRSYGFIGYMRIVIKEHTVIESHPDSAHEDLRLDHPFPRLIEYCNSLDLESMDQKEHSHTPWIVIVYKYLQKWKESHDGNAPKNYKEKLLFKEFIKQGIRSNKEGFPLDEENFDEAVKSVNTALVPSSMPSEVRKLFEDPCCSNLDTESSSFWILVRAVKEFVDNEGKDLLPLRGTIPDMTADSKRYIQLQHVYHGQADDDVAVVTEKVRKIEQSIAKEEPVNTLNMPPPNYESCISDHDIKLFCKNAAFLRIFRSRSLAEEYNNKTANLQEIAQHLGDEDNDDDFVFYVLLRGVDKFYEEYNRYPGVYEDQIEADVLMLKTSVQKILHDWGLNPTSIKDDYIHEICRYGAAELHTISSFIGGAAAQEAIKIITKQFVPFNNTYIYNAMKQSSLTVQL